MRIAVGQPAHHFTTRDVTNCRISLEHFRGQPTLLSFFRSAACPLCSLHVHNLTQAAPHWLARGFQILGVFETSVATTIRYAATQNPPFPLVADGAKEIFALYGIESAPLKVPVAMLRHAPTYFDAWRKNVGGRITDGDMGLLPADLILNPDLTVAVAHYGKDIGDHLSITSVNAFVDQYYQLHAPVHAT